MVARKNMKTHISSGRLKKGSFELCKVCSDHHLSCRSCIAVLTWLISSHILVAQKAERPIGEGSKMRN